MLCQAEKWLLICDLAPHLICQKRLKIQIGILCQQKMRVHICSIFLSHILRRMCFLHMRNGLYIIEICSVVSEVVFLVVRRRLNVRGNSISTGEKTEWFIPFNILLHTYMYFRWWILNYSKLKYNCYMVFSFWHYAKFPHVTPVKRIWNVHWPAKLLHGQGVTLRVDISASV
jgi:hypothetical protein